MVVTLLFYRNSWMKIILKLCIRCVFLVLSKLSYLSQIVTEHYVSMIIRVEWTRYYDIPIIRGSKAIHVFKNSVSYAMAWRGRTNSSIIRHPVDSRTIVIFGWSVSSVQIQTKNGRLELESDRLNPCGW